MTRRQVLGLATAAAAIPLLRPVLSVAAAAAVHRDLRFRVLRHGSPVGEHRVTFRPDGDRLTVETRVEIAVKVLFFTAFRFRHESEEAWQTDRLVAVKSTTDNNGALREVSGHAVAGGFRVGGEDVRMVTPYYAGIERAVTKDVKNLSEEGRDAGVSSG